MTNNQWYYHSTSDGKYAKIQGNKNEGVSSENWLVSPYLDLDVGQESILNFQMAMKYGTSQATTFSVLISKDYEEDVQTATWTNLGYTVPSSTDFVFYPAGPIDLSAFHGERVVIALKTTHDGSSNATRTYLIDDIEVKENPFVITPQYKDEFDWGSLGYWSSINANGTANSWNYHSYGFPQVLGNTNTASENWLVSPAVNLQIGDDVVLHFDPAYKNGNANSNNLSLWVSSDYTGNVTTATWAELSFIHPSKGNFTWTDSGEIDLAAHNGQTVYFAFKAEADGTNNANRSYFIDDVEFIPQTVGSGGPNILETSVPSNWTTTSGSSLTISKKVVKPLNGIGYKMVRSM